MIGDDVAAANEALAGVVARVRDGDPWGAVNALLRAQEHISKALSGYVIPEIFSARKSEAASPSGGAEV